MSRTSSIAMWAVTLLLVLVYFFPLWSISLQAPQYPEGIGMHIWIDGVTGHGPHDLKNINGLNHYIGMKEIHAEAIPELRYMKYFLAFLIATAALTALLRRRRVLIVWVIIAVTLSVVGMADFYKWEYNYGHDLNPDAAIKVPGMNYQPPMFGTKQLLNFRATAWPGIAGIAAMLGVGIGSLALILEGWRARRKAVLKATASPAALKAASALLLASMFAVSCSRGPQPIAYGSDECQYCRMGITDDRYGTEVVTKKGRAYKFDSIECMVNMVSEGEDFGRGDVHAWYVTDFANRGTLIDAGGAVFLHSEKLPSPMGAGLTAFAARNDAEEMLGRAGGSVLDWEGVSLLLGAGAHTPQEAQR